MVDQKLIEFVKEHRDDDVQRLLLSSSRYPGVDIRLAASLIIAKNKISKKVPSWEKIDDLYFPDNLSVEQASSEITAKYKKRFVKGGIVIDMTGGLGVDSCFLSQSAGHLIYFERNSEICEAAKHNFNSLHISNISVLNKEVSGENIGEIGEIATAAADLIYLDPARRNHNLKRVYAITDYQPNILLLKDHMFKLANSILIKVSPMVDISATIRQINEIVEVHVLSVNNECKELLFLLRKESDSVHAVRNDVKIFTVNFCKGEKSENFDFDFYKESDSLSQYSKNELFTYLYEPNSSILKAGAFKTLGEFFGVKKLHKHTHLYTSASVVKDFPGRTFVIKEIFDFKKDVVKDLRKSYPKANISTRNFPLTPRELKKLLKIDDGGDLYIFGCTLLSGVRKILVCTKVS